MSSTAERRIFLYFVALVVPVLALVATLRPSADLAGHLAAKTAAYKVNPEAFDLVMLGDSRTYCAFHPPYLEHLLGHRVANLAAWSHWLPTQHAQIRDLVGNIPKSTTIVWSVGYQNFEHCEGCTPARYPIDRNTAAFYQRLELPNDTYAGNVRLSPVRTSHRRFRTERLPEIYEAAFNWLMQPLKSRAPAFGAMSPEAHVDYLRQRRDVSDARLVYANGLPTSVETRFKAGGYERTELDPSFFREAQVAYAKARASHELQTPYMDLFQATLDLLAEHDHNVIVNVMEESPHTYASRDVQLARRELMDTEIRAAVEARGFAYVRIDWDRVASSAYFDYNHLNRRGARDFMDLFAARVRPALIADAGG